MLKKNDLPVGITVPDSLSGETVEKITPDTPSPDDEYGFLIEYINWLVRCGFEIFSRAYIDNPDHIGDIPREITPNTVKEASTETTATYILYSGSNRETTRIYFDTATWTDKERLELKKDDQVVGKTDPELLTEQSRNKITQSE